MMMMMVQDGLKCRLSCSTAGQLFMFDLSFLVMIIGLYPCNSVEDEIISLADRLASLCIVSLSLSHFHIFPIF